MKVTDIYIILFGNEDATRFWWGFFGFSFLGF